MHKGKTIFTPLRITPTDLFHLRGLLNTIHYKGFPKSNLDECPFKSITDPVCVQNNNDHITHFNY